jgi:GT2 family glycosyltransferase
MKTAVIIATHRRPDGLARVLEGLAAGPRPAGLEILVVENGPPSGARDVTQASRVAAQVRYFHRAAGNKSLALNHGLQHTEAEFVVFLDDDVGVPPDLLDAYLGAARRRGRGHFFGGGLDVEAATPCPPHLAPYLPRSARGWLYAEAEAEIPAGAFDFFFGANWAAFRADLLAAGLFAPDLGIAGSAFSPVGEETELQHRLVAAGLRPVYVPAVVRHPAPAAHYTTGWLWRRRFRLGLAEWTTTHAGRAARGRAILGIPPWLLATAATRHLQLAWAILTGAPRSVRTELLMEGAHLLGLLRGAARRRPASSRQALSAEAEA